MKKILETIFSVKNRTVINEKEKILTIFGIKVILSSVPIYIYISGSENSEEVKPSFPHKEPSGLIP
ncbi:MAG: hypothetical protein K1W03_00490, partial [Mailhella sp.]